MNKKITLTLVALMFVLGIISTIGGATFAYFYSSTSSNDTDLTGKSFNLSAGVVVTPIANGEMIPMNDNLLSTALANSDVCVDSRDYYACNLYRITFSNDGIAQTFTGAMTTNSGTTFGNNVLKYQLLTKTGNVYTSVTDTATLSTSTTNYFKLNNTDISFVLSDGTTTTYTTDYYLVIWLSDNGSDQPTTQNKHLSASLTFTSTIGDEIVATFA